MLKISDEPKPSQFSINETPPSSPSSFSLSPLIITANGRAMKMCPHSWEVGPQ